jgi:hypothetical protein
LAIVWIGRSRRSSRYAIIFVVFQQDLLVSTGDKVTRGYGWNSGFLGPLRQVLGKTRRKLAQLEGFFLHLFREDVDRRRGFAVRRVEIEPAQRYSVLQINPYKSAAREIWSTAARDQQVTSIADSNRQMRALDHHIERVRKRHVPAVMKCAIRDHAVQYFSELFISNQIARRRAVELIKKCELIGWNGLLKDGRIVIRYLGRRRTLLRQKEPHRHQE